MVVATSEQGSCFFALLLVLAELRLKDGVLFVRDFGVEIFFNLMALFFQSSHGALKRYIKFF